MKKTIIFDLGGVLVYNSSKEMFGYFEKELNLPYDILYPAVVKHWKLWESGKISEEELWKRVEQEIGQTLQISKPLWLNAYTFSYREDQQMFTLLSQLKTLGHTTALLSNIEQPVMEFIKEKQYPHLDTLIFSCDVKMAKPDKEIYKYTLLQLKSEPKDTFFIDDRLENVAAAKDLGITGIHFTGIEDLQKELRSWGVLEFYS